MSMLTSTPARHGTQSTQDGRSATVLVLCYPLRFECLYGQMDVFSQKCVTTDTQVPDFPCTYGQKRSMLTLFVTNFRFLVYCVPGYPRPAWQF